MEQKPYEFFFFSTFVLAIITFYLPFFFFLSSGPWNFAYLEPDVTWNNFIRSSSCLLTCLLVTVFIKSRQKSGLNDVNKFHIILNIMINLFTFLFILFCRSEESYNVHTETMPWLRIPFSQEERRKKLATALDVQAIPTLVILDPRDNIITAEARAELLEDPEGLVKFNSSVLLKITLYFLI